MKADHFVETKSQNGAPPPLLFIPLTSPQANFESLIGLVFNLLSVKVFDKNRKKPENMNKISNWVWEIWLFKF